MTTVNVSLYDIAHARSGDKGSGANVGIVAYTSYGYAFLRQYLTAEVVEGFFKPLGVGKVTRYEMPNIGAFNFLLPGILAGGGSRSLRIDAQGKTLGQTLLEFALDIPQDVYLKSKRPDAPPHES